MPSLHEILCINKTDRSNPHECISYVGGLSDDRTRWRLAQNEAVAGIESGQHAF